ncbi:MAG: 50S ribosomal protein L25/general stress protein Ctc [Gammaproteobacteria bacterium]|nr:50S ribosomal protein L25/general stress protein Ctc [Gammaproteobacteria bacterium]
MSKVDFTLSAEVRTDLGKGASRRLRHADRVPAIVYGGNKEPMNISLEHLKLIHNLENEAFYSHILTLDIGGKKEKAVLKDLQRHPAKPIILHADFLRVSDTEKLKMHVPLHFINESSAPGVKVGGVVTHNLTEVEVLCLPQDLPEYLEVDLTGVEIEQILHLTDIKLPKGVELVELTHGEGHDQAVAAIHKTRASKETTEESEGEGA